MNSTSNWIRTLASGERRFNPVSYLNGSVWPHDNAIIAYGFSKYGLKEEVKRIATGLFDAALFIEGQRLPELFCGFNRRPGEAPTDYPVACSPQSWSVASVFMIIQSLLGMEINPVDHAIRFYRPTLPAFIDTMSIRDLSCNGLGLDLDFVRTGDNVSISLLNRDAPVKLEITY